jgi:hypothetical protein
MWIYVPTSESSPSVPVPERETLASDWQFQALARSATWREKHIASRAWFRKWKAVPWVKRLYGVMSPHSTASRGAAAFIASLPRIPASPLAAQDSGSGGKTRGTSGRTFTASSRKPILTSCSSKTCADISSKVSEKSNAIWNARVTALSADSLARRKWARRTRESGCLPWPTSGAHDSTGARGSGHYLTDNHYTPHDLAMSTEAWSTPNAHDGRRPGGDESLSTQGGNLRRDTENWPTPDASPKRGSVNRYTQGDNRTGRALKVEAENWLTPFGAMGQDQDGTYGCGGEHAKQAQNWATPNASPAAPNMSRKREKGRISKRETEQCLERQAISLSRSLPTEPAISKGGKPCWCLTPGCGLRSHKRRLNIWFDEWLMGQPTNWSSASSAPIGFAQWEMASCRLLSRWLSAYSRSGPGFSNNEQ